MNSEEYNRRFNLKMKWIKAFDDYQQSRIDVMTTQEKLYVLEEVFFELTNEIIQEKYE